MRCFYSFIIIFFFSLSLYAIKNLEKEGDEFYNNRNISKNPVKSKEIISESIKYYKEALKNNPGNDILLYKLTKAINFKYNYLPLKFSKIEKIKTYKSLLSKLNKAYKNNKNSKYLNYSLALIWGRYGELIGVLKAAKTGIAGKIKKYGERLYKLDKKFEDGIAGVILGRLHYKTPSIPFILSWPDMNKSEKYLRESAKLFPNNYWAKFYLADTLYNNEKIEEAKKYYKEILNISPDKNNYFEILAVKNSCKKRVKELNLFK